MFCSKMRRYKMFELGKNVYHYTKGETAVDYILPSLELRMGSFQFVNDPREAKSWPFRFYSRLSKLNEHFPHDYFEEVSKYITQRSLVLCCSMDDPLVTEDSEDRSLRSGFGHPRMWAQYADNHRGVCLVLDQQRLHENIVSCLSLDSLYYGPVEYLSTTHGPVSDPGVGPYDITYWEDIYDYGLANVIDSHIRRFNKELFFTKHLEWRDEWEYRWVYRSDSSDPAFIPIVDCLNAVLLGSDCPKDISERIIAICRTHSIPVYRAHWHGWAVSVFGNLLDDGFDSENIVSLNGLSFSTSIPCGGVFAQACDQHGNVRTILIENNGNVRVMR